MDKNTLSHYGWAIIILIIIAIMLALATPFGSYVKNSVGNTIAGFGEKIATDLDADAPEFGIAGDTVVNPGDKITNNSISLMCNNSNKMRDLFYSATEIIFEEGLPDYKNFSEDIIWRDFTDSSVINTGGRVLLYMDKNDKVLHVCSKEGKIYLPEDSAYLFSAVKAKKINFNNLVDTTLITRMDYMFDFSALEEEVDFSDFDTSNVTSVEGLFAYYNLPTLNISSLDFKNVENARRVFYRTKLTKIDMNNFSEEKLKNTLEMLHFNYHLNEILIDGKEIDYTCAIYAKDQTFAEESFEYEGTFETFPNSIKRMYYRLSFPPQSSIKCSDGEYTLCRITASGRWKDSNGNYVEVNYG